MRFNRIDICDAYWWFACQFNQGQFSPEYRIFGRFDKIKFKPSHSTTQGALNENANAIYLKLSEAWSKSH